MLAKVLSSAVFGIDAYVVEVEVDIAQGLPTFATVGFQKGQSRNQKTGSRQPSRIVAMTSPPEELRSIWLRPISRRKGQPSIFHGHCILAATEVVQKANWLIILF